MRSSTARCRFRLHPVKADRGAVRKHDGVIAEALHVLLIAGELLVIFLRVSIFAHDVFYGVSELLKAL